MFSFLCSFLGKRRQIKTLQTETTMSSIFVLPDENKVHKVVKDKILFENEKNILVRIRESSSPHLIELLDVLPVERVLVLEKADSDLFDWVYGDAKNKDLVERRVRSNQFSQFMLQFLEGLRALHALQIEHYDIKPENLLIYPNEQLKICDFGFSVHQGRRYKPRVGTTCYVAPELIESSLVYIPHSMDVFSASLMILYFCFPDLLANCNSRPVRTNKSMFHRDFQHIVLRAVDSQVLHKEFLSFVIKGACIDHVKRLTMTEFFDRGIHFFQDAQQHIWKSPTRL